MTLEQERVLEKVVLKIEPRYGKFDLNEFKVSLNGELLFGGAPGDVMSYVLAFRINCPGVVDLRFLFPDGQAALMGARRAFEMFPGDRRKRWVEEPKGLDLENTTQQQAPA